MKKRGVYKIPPPLFAVCIFVCKNSCLQPSRCFLACRFSAKNGDSHVEFSAKTRADFLVHVVNIFSSCSKNSSLAFWQNGADGDNVEFSESHWIGQEVQLIRVNEC